MKRGIGQGTHPALLPQPVTFLPPVPHLPRGRERRETTHFRERGVRRQGEGRESMARRGGGSAAGGERGEAPAPGRPLRILPHRNAMYVTTSESIICGSTPAALSKHCQRAHDLDAATRECGVEGGREKERGHRPTVITIAIDR